MTLRLPGSDAAVSEVVGYVLVTGITVLAITLVLLTSGPALDEIRSNQQHDSMLRYFHDLDQNFDTILSGSPSGAAPVWRVAMSSGSLSVDNGTDNMWVYATDHDEDHLTSYAEFNDEDNRFKIDVDGSLDGNLLANASVWEGGEDTEITADVSSAASGATHEITLRETDTGRDVPLAGNTVQVEFEDSGNTDGVFSQAWITDAGTIEWANPGGDLDRIVYQNTAIIALVDGGQVLHNDPRIKPTQDLEGDNVYDYIRLATVNGSASIGGRTTASVLLSSQGNYERHSTTTAERVQLYPPVNTAEAWERLLTDDNRDYRYTWTSNEAGGTVDFAEHTKPSSGELHVTMVQTQVTASLQGGA